MNKADFHTKIDGIARQLNYVVEYPTEEMGSTNTATLRRVRDQAILWIRNSGHGSSDRFKISGHYPSGDSGYRPYGIKAVEISISTKKGVYQIAREIGRRLLPKYLVELQKAIADIKSDSDYRATRLANLGKLAGLAQANLFPDPSTNSGREPSFRFGGEGNYSHLVKCWGKDAIQMELDNLTMDQARMVIEVLKD